MTVGKSSIDKIVAALKFVRENGNLSGVETYLKVYIRDGIDMMPLVKYIDIFEDPKTGDITCDKWVLTPYGESFLRRPARSYSLFTERARDRQRTYWENPRLPIEVLDALKSIKLTGEPNTTKMDVLARLQLGSQYAFMKDGEWFLSWSGDNVARDHIRKSECAQFGGKVR